MKTYALIAMGSAAGGMARFWLGSHMPAPWGTLAVNVLGSFLIGYASNWMHVHTVRFLMMVGFCGGFTTFSSFSLENLTLLRQGEVARAAGYVAASLAGCLAAVWLGFSAARWQQQ